MRERYCTPHTFIVEKNLDLPLLAGSTSGSGGGDTPQQPEITYIPPTKDKGYDISLQAGAKGGRFGGW